MKREHDIFTKNSRHPLRRQRIQNELVMASGSCAFAQDDSYRQDDGGRSTQDDNRRKHVNILIVEDNPIACVALENLLSKLGEKADIAIDGEQAIEKTRIHNYRLILMDIGLPGKDGCAVTKIIRQREKAHKFHPAYIVAQSSHMNKEVEKQCLAVGMNACCAKPLTAEIIQELLNTIMKSENLTLLG